MGFFRPGDGRGCQGHLRLAVGGGCEVSAGRVSGRLACFVLLWSVADSGAGCPKIALPIRPIRRVNRRRPPMRLHLHDHRLTQGADSP